MRLLQMFRDDVRAQQEAQAALLRGVLSHVLRRLCIFSRLVRKMFVAVLVFCVGEDADVRLCAQELADDISPRLAANGPRNLLSNGHDSARPGGPPRRRRLEDPEDGDDGSHAPVARRRRTGEAASPSHSTALVPLEGMEADRSAPAPYGEEEGGGSRDGEGADEDDDEVGLPVLSFSCCLSFTPELIPICFAPPCSLLQM